VLLHVEPEGKATVLNDLRKTLLHDEFDSVEP
jgi:hypothetical protein